MTETRIVPDDTYPAMFRIHWPDGLISDMANITRCRNAVHEYDKAIARKESDRRYDLKRSRRVRGEPASALLSPQGTRQPEPRRKRLWPQEPVMPDKRSQVQRED